MSPWKYALASVTGTSHGKSDLPCQDFSVCRVLNTVNNTPVLVAIAADGAGSATHSQVGASLLCSVFMEEIAQFLEAGNELGDLDSSIIGNWLYSFQDQVQVKAGAIGATSRDFACTLLFAAVGNECSAYAQIGDGAIVISLADAPESYDYVFWPQKGEYENVTYFATDPAACGQLEFGCQKGIIEEISLFTDGLQRLALDFVRQEAYIPFFSPMFAPLRSAILSGEGLAVNLSSSLERFLITNKVNERTDDDKTLILATRRSIELSSSITPKTSADRVSESASSDQA